MRPTSSEGASDSHLDIADLRRVSADVLLPVRVDVDTFAAKFAVVERMFVTAVISCPIVAHGAIVPVP